MPSDLLLTDGPLLLPIVPDGDVCYLPAIHWCLPDVVLLQSLADTVPWRAEQIVIWGKKYPQPRLVAWYGDAGRTYTYSGIRLDPLPWTKLLESIRNDVQDIVDAEFNSVLLNYYRDANDSMGFHSDDESELGSRPTIASVSLGDQRIFILKHKTRKELRPVRIPLDSGSLLVMKGDTQRNWKHGIPKERRHCGPRINLTFRCIIQ